MSTILVIDLGKYNSILCWYEVESRQAVYRSVSTTPELLRPELQRQAVSTVVIEACSQAGWVSDLCHCPCRYRATLPTPTIRPGNGSTSNGRPTRTMPSSWLGLVPWVN